MRSAVLASSLLLTACGHGTDVQGGAGSSTPQPTVVAKPSPVEGGAAANGAAAAATGAGGAGGATGAAAAPGPASATGPAAGGGEAAPPGHDFTPTGKLLFAVGACGDGGAPPEYPEALLQKHCALVQKVQREYADTWVKQARGFFAEKVPASVPKKVVYPFAGGDLSTALTVYPDADELTTLSLEPAGDPRTLEALARAGAAGAAGAAGTGDPLATTKPRPGKASSAKRTNARLEKALATIERELRFLYRVNFSNTANMQTAMSSGELPTQLVFGLSALKVHGYELASLRYFTLDETGAIHYLTNEEVAAAPPPLEGKASKRNGVFANAEIRFRKPGGRLQIYRHIRWNLDDAHLKEDPRVVRHLDAKGPVAAMTKAASYLLSWDSFSTMRGYLTRNAQWMVSDATGVAPKWGKPAGFEYETYGSFELAHLQEGHGIAPDWQKLWSSQKRRTLPFRFGYYDGKIKNHLVIMKRK